MDNTLNEQQQKTLDFLMREAEIAFRIMLQKRSTVHAFDFNGQLDGVKEVWSVLILILPKVQLEVAATKLGWKWE